MRQSIEKKREANPIKVALIVIFHGSRLALSGPESLRGRENNGLSLSGELAIVFDCIFPPVSLLEWVNGLPDWRRARHQSLPHQEEFFAEAHNACSAGFVSTSRKAVGLNALRLLNPKQSSSSAVLA
jgi:hypothetical protein